jgi:hypothetical protein
MKKAAGPNGPTAKKKSPPVQNRKADEIYLKLQKTRRFRRANGLVLGLLFHGFLLGLLLENPAGTRRTGQNEN